MNTVEEFRAPFDNKHSAVYEEGLRLISIETKMIPCVYNEALQKCGTEGKRWHCYFNSQENHPLNSLTKTRIQMGKPCRLYDGDRDITLTEILHS